MKKTTLKLESHFTHIDKDIYEKYFLLLLVCLKWTNTDHLHQIKLNVNNAAIIYSEPKLLYPVPSPIFKKENRSLQKITLDGYHVFISMSIIEGLIFISFVVSESERGRNQGKNPSRLSGRVGGKHLSFLPILSLKYLRL